MEPVVGFRAWALEGDGLLRGWAMCDFAWEVERPSFAGDRPITAHNHVGLHGRWFPDEGAGIGGFEYSPDLSTVACWGLLEEGVGLGDTIGGAIIAWGKTVFQERGFRATFAKPVALLRPHERVKYAQSIADFYDVPLLASWDAVAAHASEYGHLYSPEEIAA